MYFSPTALLLSNCADLFTQYREGERLSVPENGARFAVRSAIERQGRILFSVMLAKHDGEQWQCINSTYIDLEDAIKAEFVSDAQVVRDWCQQNLDSPSSKHLSLYLESFVGIVVAKQLPPRAEREYGLVLNAVSFKARTYNLR